MALLPLSAEDMLTTTRAVRKRLDLTRPVPLSLIEECLSIALQAPSGGNVQGWHFVVVTDPGKRARLAELYRKVFADYAANPDSGGNRYLQDPQRGAQAARVMDSAAYLAEHLHEVPVHVIFCCEGRLTPETLGRSSSFWGSLHPAAWSFMLAARLRGLGTAWTSMHLRYEREAAELLGIPYERVSQGILIPVAYTLGTDFKPAKRQPLADVLHVDGW